SLLDIINLSTIAGVSFDTRRINIAQLQCPTSRISSHCRLRCWATVIHCKLYFTRLICKIAARDLGRLNVCTLSIRLSKAMCSPGADASFTPAGGCVVSPSLDSFSVEMCVTGTSFVSKVSRIALWEDLVGQVAEDPDMVGPWKGRCG